MTAGQNDIHILVKTLQQTLGIK